MDDCFKGKNIRKRVRRNITAGFDADRHQSAVFQTNDRNEQPDPDRNRMLQRIRNGVKQHLTNFS
ncbi:hypothetical protein D3C81_1116560 [compost metagenome]